MRYSPSDTITDGQYSAGLGKVDVGGRGGNALLEDGGNLGCGCKYLASQHEQLAATWRASDRLCAQVMATNRVLRLRRSASRQLHTVDDGVVRNTFKQL